MGLCGVKIMLPRMMGMQVAIMQPVIMFVCALHMPTEKMNCVDKTLHLDVGM